MISKHSRIITEMDRVIKTSEDNFVKEELLALKKNLHVMSVVALRTRFKEISAAAEDMFAREQINFIIRSI